MKPIADDLAAARREFLDSGDDRLLPIVDAHHHYWAVPANPHPWLVETPRIAFRYGDYEAICRDYLPADHARATATHRVLRDVTMEGEWDPADPVGEARWMRSLAERCGTPQAFAAQAWLDRDDLADVLRAYTAPPLAGFVKSVRHKPKAVPRAEHTAGYAAPGSMRCPRWREGFAQVAASGLMFELQAPWWHLDEAVELARDFPATTLIVNHAGLPAERDAASLAAWDGAMQRLAGCPNVVVKVSGLGVPGRAWTPDLQRPVVEALISNFGADRLMFGSNFPVDSLLASFDEIASCLKTLTLGLHREEQLAIFCDTALRVYDLS